MTDINSNNKKALIAMSGGVDSSVAAKIINDASFECIGCTMKLYDNDDTVLRKDNTCCSIDDVEDARQVAANLKMPYYVFNFKDGFKEHVIDSFVKAYESGKTPNPCILCNRYMKFEKLYQRARELGCYYVVTGHYARIEYDGNRYLLKKAIDKSKDQSYVLYSMTQEQLKHTLFPLGELEKTKVREIATKNGFVNSNKPDSQDICFVPDGDYASFLERYTGKKYEEGHFVDCAGNVLGTHKGIVRYTVGQRKGLGISYNEPIYVKDIDVKNNTVVLARDSELYSDRLIANDINLISVDKIDKPMEVTAKIRYRHTEAKATVTQISEDEIEVVFKEPQRAITKGQAVVLYKGDIVVGGGTIC